MRWRAVVGGFLGAIGLISVASAQSIPNGNTPLTQGQVWTVPQWNTAWQAKVDVTNGASTSETLTTPTITSGTLNSAAMSGTFTGTPSFTGLVTMAGSGTGLAVSNNQTVGGTLGVTGATTLTGLLTANGAVAVNNPANGPGLTISGNSTSLSNTYPIAWTSASGYVGGTLTGSSIGSMLSYTVNDDIASTSSNSPEMFQFNEVVASNGNSASGGRITFNVFQNIIGSSQSGTYTNTGITQALNMAIWDQSNEGGTSTVYQGAHTTFATYCELLNGATYVNGCAGFEFALTGATGSSYQRNTQGLFVHLGSNVVAGTLGPDLGLVWAEQTGATVVGYKCLFCIGTNGNGEFPTNPYGAIVYSYYNGATQGALGSAVDTTQVTFSGCDYRAPFSVACPLQAKAITGATRLTSDAKSASGYIYEAELTGEGSSYTSQPSASVTGCSSATINTQLGSGGVVGELGVSAPGTGCEEESTVAISGGGGSGATGKLVIAGNTMNFPIDSTVDVACSIAATSLAHSGSDAIGWHIVFGATMGATSSTAAIVGSPSWTQDYATSSAASHISISAPTADTTLGALNITITPSTGTWDVGGRCTLTKSAQT